ncbi:MAG: GAF domain-containing protein [Chloroflexota bacterium]
MTHTPRQTSLSFPLWMKLALGFAVAIILPAITVGLIFLTARQDIDRRNIESYMRQVGQRQRQVLVGTFTDGGNVLRAFSTDRDANRLLIGLLLQDVESTPPLPDSTVEEVSGLLQDSLLDPRITPFTDVSLLSRDGELLAYAGDDPIDPLTLDTDASGSAAYQQITGLRGQDSTVRNTVVVARPGSPIIQLVQVVNLRETDNVVGYLVAELDINQEIMPALNFVDTTFPAYSFLRSNDNIVIQNGLYAEEVAVSRDSIGVERALAGETDFSLYRVQGGNGIEVGGYYAPLPGTPLILISQVNVDDVTRQATDYFGAPGFVLVTGVLALILIVLVTIYTNNIADPIYRLRRAIQAVSVGNFDEPVPDLNRADEFGELARSFVDMRQQTQLLIQDLQTRINSRTRDMETTHEISRVAARQRNLQQLMDDVVHLITKRFSNIYHAQIFLLDADRRYAVLRASTGEAGRTLLARGHKLPVGSISVIGQVTAQNDVIVARDTAMSEVHRQNEFLRETRAELAIPLRIGDQVIGALDVQSRERATFDPDQVRVLQTMADQLAIAIENARLYEESTRRIRSVREQNRTQTGAAWRDYMFDRRTQRLVQQAGTPTDADLEDVRRRSAASGQPVVGQATQRGTVPIGVPLRLRGEVIGVVAWEIPEQEYNGNRVQLANDLADRLALSLDNTRLFEQSQRATERERMVNSISARLTAQTDVNHILQAAVREVGQALRVPEVSIRLSSASSTPDETDNDDT